MTINDQIRDEKLQYDINREAAKISALSSGKIHKYEYLTGEEILPPNQHTLNTLKSNDKLTIEDVIPKSALNNDEAKKELDKIKEIEKTAYREKLVYETKEYTYSVKDFQTIKTFGRDIYEGNTMLKEVDEYQADLLDKIINFMKKTKPKSPEKKQIKKALLLKTCIIFLKIEKKFLTLLKVKYSQ